MLDGLNEPKVEAWLNANVAELTGPFTYSLIAGGRSNLTYLGTDANGTKFVLRRPPLGHVLATAHDMAREHRIISAVGKTAVPVPRTLGLCTDDDVNGAPFYVMGYVDGVVLDSQERGELCPENLREKVAFDLIDVLAALHSADIDKIGLGDLAKRDGYVERQVKRWTTQWENSKTRELPEIEEVGKLLKARLPKQQATVIAHGDYRLGNCLTDISKGHIAAVLDWELCTLGDPLADIGYIGVYWSEPGESLRHNDPSGLPGFPGYSALVSRYADKTGFDVSGINYYKAFSAFRLAVISEGVYARYLHGAMGQQDYDPTPMKEGTEQLAIMAYTAMKEQ